MLPLLLTFKLILLGANWTNPTLVPRPKEEEGHALNYLGFNYVPPRLSACANG